MKLLTILLLLLVGCSDYNADYNKGYNESQQELERILRQHAHCDSVKLDAMEFCDSTIRKLHSDLKECRDSK